MRTPYFITAALPYANGPLHFGHLAGVYIPADIYHRHCVLLERDAVFICGSDEHGVAITLGAEAAGQPYQAYVDVHHARHQALFAAYNIQCTYYGRTSAPGHAPIAQEFFTALRANGALVQQQTEQPYCNQCARFVPDRYLGGTCRHCGYTAARGDECPQCGKWLSFADLQDPYCQTCKGRDIGVRGNTEWALDLPRFAPQLREWLVSRTDWKEEIRSYAVSLIDTGLPQRAITRDLAWGVPVPGEEASGKKLYVWFEAPIGYLSMLMAWAVQCGAPDDWRRYWGADARMIHFIGKDNIIFHTIVWPAMLLAKGEGVLPANVPANMFVQFAGRQFSKSAGWYVDAMDALEAFGEDRLRYHLINLIPEHGDSDFTWEHFGAKVNGELINNLANFAHRVLSLVAKPGVGTIVGADIPRADGERIFEQLRQTSAAVRMQLDAYEFRRALAEILRLGEQANKFCNDAAPWKLIKQNPPDAKPVLASCLLYLIGIGAFLQPFLPRYAGLIRSLFPNTDFRAIYQGRIDWEVLGNPFVLRADVSLAIPKVTDDQLNAQIAKLPA